MWGSDNGGERLDYYDAHPEQQWIDRESTREVQREWAEKRAKAEEIRGQEIEDILRDF